MFTSVSNAQNEMATCDITPGRARGFLEMFKSDLYAQNGMSAELELEVR